MPSRLAFHAMAEGCWALFGFMVLNVVVLDG